MSRKIADLPQNWIMRSIRDKLRRKQYKHLSISTISYARGNTGWATFRCYVLRNHHDRSMGVQLALCPGTIGYQAYVGYKAINRSNIDLPPFENPKFDPDAIVEFVLLVYDQLLALDKFHDSAKRKMQKALKSLNPSAPVYKRGDQ